MISFVSSYLMSMLRYNEPLTRIVKSRVVHAPGMMPGTFSLPPRVNDPDMHHDTCMAHVPWCIPGSLTSGFRWRWWRGNVYRYSRYMHNPQFYLFHKRPIGRDADIWMQVGLGGQRFIQGRLYAWSMFSQHVFPRKYHENIGWNVCSLQLLVPCGKFFVIFRFVYINFRLLCILRT